MSSPLNTLATAAFLCLAFLPIQPAHASDDGPADTGTIQGIVRITEKLSEKRMRFRLYPGVKPAPPPTETASREDEWRNIVIYLRSHETLEPAGVESGQNFNMAQEGETFIPHVLPIPVRSTVEFPNHDPIFHNVFSLSGASTFDLGRYPRGDSRSVIFDRAGIVPVFCHIHSDMNAIILVLENSYFTVPGSDGSYRISGIPAGTYSLVAWHERTEPVEIPVVVERDQVLELNLTVPIEYE